jgi:hypothetical protein
LRRVEILRLRAVAFTSEKFHRDEGIKKVGDPPWVQPEFPAQLGSRNTPISQFGEQAELDGGQQNFGIPKRKCGLKDGIGPGVFGRHIGNDIQPLFARNEN